MSEEPRNDHATTWIVVGVGAVIALLGCCLIGVVLAAIGFFAPARVVSVTQVSSGQVVMATPILIDPISTDTPLPLPTLTSTPPEGSPTTRPTTTAPSTSEVPAAGPESAQTGTVVKIIDGDTIDVSIAGQVFRVRYIRVSTALR